VITGSSGAAFVNVINELDTESAAAAASACAPAAGVAALPLAARMGSSARAGEATDICKAAGISTPAHDAK
jgi:hypothetical protein